LVEFFLLALYGKQLKGNTIHYKKLAWGDINE